MFDRARILLTIAAYAVATSVAAQTPAPTTAFDGTYVGVSRELNTELMQRGVARGGAGRALQCEQPGVPDSLIITNGVVKSLGSSDFDGIVNPQGTVVIRTPRAFRIDAQIDAQGTMTGKGTGTGGCVNTFVWRKQSR